MFLLFLSKKVVYLVTYEKVNKKYKIFVVIVILFAICFCQVCPSFAQDLSNNWDYTYTNFSDIYQRDIDTLVSTIIRNCQNYSVANDNWNYLVNDRNFKKCYFYIPQTDTSDTTYYIYCYLPTNTINQGVMNYYKWSNFPCYLNLQNGYVITVSRTGNSINYTSSDVPSFNMPTIFYGYSTQLLVQAVNDKSTVNIQKEISNNLSQQTQSIQEQTEAINENTKTNKELNNYIMDENVTGDVVLPTSGASNDNVNGFFTRLSNLLANSFGYSDDVVSSVSFSIGGSSGTLHSDWVKSFLININGGELIITLVNGFWWFVIIYFIYNDIRKQIDKVSNFTFVNETINTDLL